jgi:hypothetical protein
MKIVNTGISRRVLVFFDEGEEAPNLIRYRKLTWRRRVKAPMRPSERKMYAEAHIYET